MHEVGQPEISRVAVYNIQPDLLMAIGTAMVNICLLSLLTCLSRKKVSGEVELRFILSGQEGVWECNSTFSVCIAGITSCRTWVHLHHVNNEYNYDNG